MAIKKVTQPLFKSGDKVDYYKRGILFPSMIAQRAEHRVRGGGYMYRIIASNPDISGNWSYWVAERTLIHANLSKEV